MVPGENKLEQILEECDESVLAGIGYDLRALQENGFKVMCEKGKRVVFRVVNKSDKVAVNE